MMKLFHDSVALFEQQKTLCIAWTALIPNTSQDFFHFFMADDIYVKKSS